MDTYSQIMYCIMHETEVDVIASYHLCDISDQYGYVIEWCAGPFTTCPPPELLEFWEDFVTEPSPEEMELSDACANEILLELSNAKSN